MVSNPSAFTLKVFRQCVRIAFAGLMIFLPLSKAWSGAFVFAGTSNGVDLVTHPTPYTGTGGVMTVRICIDPNSANAADMQISMQNIVSTYNQLQVTTGNLQLGSKNNIPSNYFDFESVALHEVGHCIGMAHPNASSESGLTGAQTNYTKATTGANGVFDLDPGPDGVIGSGDDIRGDDVNLHWFRKLVNNPFILDTTVVDSTTYSINLADLPVGQTFAANGDRAVGALLGYPNTEAVMQQGTSYDEAQRTLTADDVATLRYAMSGVDEIHGTSDDYTINLVDRGITTTNCDVTISISTITGLAYCQTGGASISQGHYHITSANIYLSDAYNWFFNDVSTAQDTTPNQFTFTDQNNVPLSTVITSNSIIVSGIDAAAVILVAGGEYSVNQGMFTATSGTVNSGDQVQVRHISSTSYSASVNTILTIGGVSDTFTSTTESVDSKPNGFTFTDLTDVPLNSVVVSNAVILSGINTSASISISGGEYSINGGAFTSDTGTVVSGDTVVVRHTSSGAYSTTTDTMVTIGGVSDTFSSTTIAAPGTSGSNDRGSGSGGGALGLTSLFIMFASLLLRARRRKWFSVMQTVVGEKQR